MLRVYLDQNKWIDLARATEGHRLGAPFEDALAFLRAAVAAGDVSLPLSTGHVFETWKARRADVRHPLAAVMADLSRNHAIAGPWQVLPAELDRAFAARFGRPRPLLPLQPFGFGMVHRSGQPDLAFSPEVTRVLLQANPHLSETELTATLDAALLAGPNQDLPTSDLSQPPLEPAKDYRDEEIAQAQRFAAHRSDRDERRRALAARLMISIGDPMNEARLRAQVSNEDLLALGPDALTELLLDLPGQAGVLELQSKLHDNPQNKWAANDLVDTSYLSVAVGYCDVVVTERKWTHHFNRTELPARFDTTVISDLTELPAIVLGASRQPD